MVVATGDDHGSVLADDLARQNVEVIAVATVGTLAEAFGDRGTGGDSSLGAAVAACDAIVVAVDRWMLTSAVVAACDAHGVRIVALADDPDDIRHARALGLTDPLPTSAAGWQIADAVTASSPVSEAAGSRSRAGEPSSPDQLAPVTSPRVIVVWGPGGSPGRSTVAVELAVELARGSRHVALVDADSHAPSIALALGLPDEGPGFAAACRSAERGELDAAELERVSTPLGVADGAVDVLTGINRPARWPELSASRVAAALEVCRSWADDIVVDVAASLERDEEIMSDLEGPQRNAATLAALGTADVVVAVAAADPVGVSRFVRAYPELRAEIGATDVHVIANRLRAGALGIDARGQIRRTLDRFAGVEDLDFLPADPRAADAAVLMARPIADAAARSPVVQGLRRFVGQRIATPRPVERSGRGPRRDRHRTA